MSVEPAPHRPGTVVEAPRRLSESMLWELMATYYRHSGVQAWASGAVPHLLTTGPMLARAYAQVVEGFLADCGAGHLGAIDRAEPLYVVEIGAGTGRLAWNMLRFLDATSCGPLRSVYVLTDAMRRNVDFWLAHPRLAPLIAAGRLAVAQLDVTSGQEIVLEGAASLDGTVLAPGRVANPMAVVANYLFDVIPQDLFAVVGGRLLEELVAVVVDDERDSFNISAPDLFSRVWLATRQVEVPTDRYGDPDLDGVLREVAADRSGPSDCRFLFPSSGLRCLRTLLGIADERLLLISGERPGALAGPGEGGGSGAAAGGASSEAVRPGALLAMGVHGSTFSLPVDHDILARLVRAHGGEMLMPSAAPAGLVVTAAIVGDGGSAAAVRHRYALAVDEAGPEDLFLALRAVGGGAGGLSLAMVLALIRVSGYDANLFTQFHGQLSRLLPEAEPDGVAEAVRVAAEVWERYYPIEERTDLAFGIAALLAPAGRWSEALEYLGWSRAEHGPTPLGSFNSALCHLLLGDVGSATSVLDEALQLDPALEQARDLRRRLDEMPFEEAADGGPEGPGSAEGQSGEKAGAGC